MTLSFEGEREVVLNKTTFDDRGTSRVASLGVEFRWGKQSKAFALCFTEYAAWGAEGRTGDYFFEAASHGSPAATLGNMIEEGEKSLDAILGSTLTASLFAGSFNRSGKSSAPRKINLNSHRLPSDHVQIKVGGHRIRTPAELWELADKIRRQGKWGHPDTALSRDSERVARVAARKPAPKRGGVLPQVAYPFRLVTNAPPLFSSAAKGNSLVPSWQDHLQNRVYRHPTREKVQNKLERSGLALVAGQEGCGKTVLAASLAVDVIQGSGRCFYLDFAKEEVHFAFKEALTTLHQLAAKQTLFILDNVHSSPDLAHDLATEWQTDPNGSQLLLLGRAIPPQPGKERLEDFFQEPLILEIGVADIEGVFRAVISSLGNIKAITPPRQVLQQWQREFQTDLAGFCAAVMTQASSLLAGRWHLKSYDPNRKFWQMFLQPVSEDERWALFKIAVLSEYGIPTPASSVRSAVLKNSLQSGLVFRSEFGQGHHKVFELCHSSMAKAILDANAGRYDPRQALQEIARHSPLTAMLLAGVYEHNGQLPAAVSMLRLALANPKCFSALLDTGLGRTRAFTTRFVRLGLLTWKDVDAQILAEEDRLVRAVVKELFMFPDEFLKFCQHYLPQVNSHLCSALSHEANAKALAERLFDGSLSSFGNYVTSLKSSHPLIGRMLANVSSSDSILRKIEQHLLSDSLGSSIFFIAAFLNTFPEEVFQRCHNVLLSPGNQQLFKSKLRSHTLHGLTVMLRRITRPRFSNHLRVYFMEILSNEPELLGDALEEASLDEVLAFADFSETRLPQPVHEFVCSRLQSIRNVNLFPIPMVNWAWTIKAIRKRRPTLLHSIGAQQIDRDELWRIIRASCIYDVHNSIRVLERRSETQPLSKAIIEVLLKPSNKFALGWWISRGRLDDAIRFVLFAQVNGLKLLASTISEALTTPVNQANVARFPWKVSLSCTWDFLSYARKQLPAAFSTVAAALAHPANKTKLVAKAKNCQLDFLTGFMAFSKKELPSSVYEVLLEYLSDPESQKEIIMKSRSIPAHFLKPAVDSLANTLPEFHKRLLRELPISARLGR